MINALVIVWRESLEAMLIIGILLSWISRQPEPQMLKGGLWVGVASGVGLAIALGAIAFEVQSAFVGLALERFQLAMVLVASALILQMVLWMHRHGRHMKRELEGRVEDHSGALGIALVAMLAVGREGAETFVFLYGLGMETVGTAQLALLGAATAGLALAGATSWLVARGARYLNYRVLFRASEILLLLIANALLANAIDRMISLEWLPPLLDPAWDTSGFLEDGHGLGRFLADFVGYRARPAGSLLMASFAFWVYALWRLRDSDTRQASHG